jgi:hypothetical protein
MKKFVASILAVLYLSTSLGATIHLHYCMGKLVSMGLVNHDSRNCDYCGMPKYSSYQNFQVVKNNCCKDEQHQLKADRDQKLVQAELQFLKLFPDATAVHFQPTPVFQFSNIAIANPATHAPPGTGKQTVFLLNCNFRI